VYESNRSLRRESVALIAWLLALATSACGDGDEPATASPVPTASFYSLGTTLTIRGQEIVLPSGILYSNEAIDCQKQETALSTKCASGLKLLSRGNSYLLFDPNGPRVVARRIEQEDEADFRPLLGIIAGTSDAWITPTPSPAP
jgi:hypothetical protein